jgi:hypothetical protein
MTMRRLDDTAAGSSGGSSSGGGTVAEAEEEQGWVGGALCDALSLFLSSTKAQCSCRRGDSSSAHDNSRSSSAAVSGFLFALLESFHTNIHLFFAPVLVKE